MDQGGTRVGPHVIVLGNEKGGTGKSTTAVHIAVALAAAGVSTAAIDLDQRQRTFARYMENRERTARRIGVALPAPETLVLSEEEGVEGLDKALSRWSGDKTAIVIDTPGRHGVLAEAALARADTLVTPMNDSFVDLDLLAEVDPQTWKVRKASFYAELVWETRKRRAATSGREVDWLVLRNRLAALEAKNQRRMTAALRELSKRIGFRLQAGLAERVIYRELFPAGLTLLDTAHMDKDVTLSHVAARAELRTLMNDLRLPFWPGRETAPAA